MNFLKRVLYSLRHKWIKNVLLTCLFFVLFTSMLCVCLVFSASGQRVEQAKKNLANAVTLAGPTVEKYVNDDTRSRATVNYEIPRSVAIDFVNSDYVDGYSMEGAYNTVKTVDCQAVISEESAKLLSVLPEFLEETKTRCTVIPVSNSQYNTYFLAKGFKIISGDSINPQDNLEQVALVSEEFAQVNGLAVGDEFVISFPDSYKEAFKMDDFEPMTLKIKGIFSFPKITEDTIFEDSQANMIFLPIGVSDKYNQQLPIPQQGYPFVTAYLKNPNDLDAFIEEVKSKLTIGLVSEQIAESSSGETVLNKRLIVSQEEVDQGNYPYQLILDRAWYEMVTKPMERVNGLTGMMVVAIVVGTVLILALIMVLGLKGRKTEFGILLSLGEKPVRVFWQILLEMMIPVILAACVALAMAQPLGDFLFKQMIQANSSQTVESNETITALVEGDIDKGGLMYDLMNRTSYGVVADTEITLELTPAFTAAYIIWILVISIAAVFFQVFLYLRQSPAYIIMDRGK